MKAELYLDKLSHEKHRQMGRFRNELYIQKQTNGNYAEKRRHYVFLNKQANAVIVRKEMLAARKAK
jgi:hypothetical protein